MSRWTAAAIEGALLLGSIGAYGLAAVGALG